MAECTHCRREFPDDTLHAGFPTIHVCKPFRVIPPTERPRAVYVTDDSGGRKCIFCGKPSAVGWKTCLPCRDAFYARP